PTIQPGRPRSQWSEFSSSYRVCTLSLTPVCRSLTDRSSTLTIGCGRSLRIGRATHFLTVRMGKFYECRVRMGFRFSACQPGGNKTGPRASKVGSFLRGENPTGGCWHGENALVIDFEGDLILLRTLVFANTAKSVRAPTHTLQGEHG